MALPSQAIEKLVRDPGRTTGGYRQLLLLSATLFFLALVIYFGLRFGYQPYLDSSVTKLDQQIQQFGQEISKEEQDNITAFYSQLVNLRTLLGARVVGSPVLDLLERDTLPGVYYTKASLNTLNSEFSLSGAARTVEDISRQAAIFEHDSSVMRVNFANIVGPSSASESWQFTMSIFVRPELLKPSITAPVETPQ